MKFNVREVEFDFDDDYANGFDLTFDEEIELRDLTLVPTLIIMKFVCYTIIIVITGNKTTSRCDTNLTVILPLCLWLFCP